MSIERVWVSGKGFFLVTSDVEELYKSNEEYLPSQIIREDYECEFFRLKIGEDSDLLSFFAKPVKFLGYISDHNASRLYFLMGETRNLFGKKFWIFEVVVLFYRSKTKFGISDFQVLLFNTQYGGINVFYVRGRGWDIGGRCIKGVI